MNLNELIRKRHPYPRWIVIEECGNDTGWNVSRHADAVALGIWPSDGYAVHGYECKASRSDVQKELADPSKSDAVGKYCDYWWLVVEDLKIIDGLVIPDAWGILAPKAQVLRVHRKAPKRDAKETSRAFAAAMIRKVCENWVPRHEHDDVLKTAYDKAKADVEHQKKWEGADAQRELANLKSIIDTFKEHSGIDLFDKDRAWMRSDYFARELGDAVKVVLEARQHGGRDQKRPGHSEAIALAEGELNNIDREIERFNRLAEHAQGRREQLRVFVDGLRGDDQPQRQLALVVDE